MTGTSIKFLAVLLFIVLIPQVMPSPAPTHPSVRGNSGLQPPTGTHTVAHTPTPTGTPTPIATSPPVCGWNAVPGPKLSGWMGLQDVAAISPNDIWTVGVYRSSQYASEGETLTLHWDGTGWRRIPSPSPGTLGRLNGVAAVASDDVWAVGSYHESGRRILILHWDGSTWSLVPSPNPDGGGFLNDVAAVSANDVWAVGAYFTDCGWRALILHWDGTSWNVVPSPFPYPGYNIELNGIAALAADDIWAVGSNSGQTLTLHWDGVRWRVIPSPSVGMSSHLGGVAAVSADDVWAVGGYRSAAQRSHALILHWDGTAWNVVSGPDVGAGSWLWDVTASAAAAWAVGSFIWCSNTGSRTLVLRWNGVDWEVAFTAPSYEGFLGFPGTLSGIAALGTDEVWAVGSDLIMRYNQSATCVTPTPMGIPIIPTPTCAPPATPTATPTSPPTPILLRPADGIILPQPVQPDEWHFVWRAVSCAPLSDRTGISIRGPGGRCLGGEAVKSSQGEYEFRYATDQPLPNGVLGPWYWSAWNCYSYNRSETRTFWVWPTPGANPPTSYLPLLLRFSASRSPDR